MALAVDAASSSPVSPNCIRNTGGLGAFEYMRVACSASAIACYPAAACSTPRVFLPNSTDGLGVFEYMLLVEELQTEPIWVINNGVAHGDSEPIGLSLPLCVSFLCLALTAAAGLPCLLAASWVPAAA